MKFFTLLVFLTTFLLSFGQLRAISLHEKKEEIAQARMKVINDLISQSYTKKDSGLEKIEWNKYSRLAPRAARLIKARRLRASKYL
jgi:hypothetical protein